MFYPLLKHHARSFNIARAAASISRWFKNLGEGLRIFFAAFRRRQPQGHLPDPEKLRQIASALASGSAGRKTIGKKEALFARLILWGIETQGVPWKPSIGPGEYCGLLAAAYGRANAIVPEAAIVEDGRGSSEMHGAICRAGELFEKALYSKRRLLGSEEEEFRRLIRNITA